MEKKFKLGVIGAGFMANAIIKGIIESKTLNCSDVLVSDVSSLALDKISNALNVSITSDNVYLADNSEFVIFAVKPQNLSTLLGQIKNCSCNKYISIMAGIKKDKIKKEFNFNVKVARCMPNTPCSVGFGAVGIDLSDYLDGDNLTDKDFICGLFSCFSNVVLVSEDKLNAVTGVSGSAPAYFYTFLKAIVESGVENGLSYEEALNLATTTMIGSGKMVLNDKNKSLDELINAVCSKGGTTIEAINVFNNNDINNITKKAISACIKRASELENL